MPVENAITTSPIVEVVIHDLVAPFSESVNIVVSVQGRSTPKWDFGSSWAQNLGQDPVITPAYVSQDDMRFGARVYGRSEIEIIHQAVAERQPLAEPPIPLS